MARIAGVNLPENKKIGIALTAIYGLGRSNVHDVLRQAQIGADKKINQLTAEEVTRLTKAISEIPVEGVLRKQVLENIKRLKIISSYRGQRHNKGLPVRGQRTRSNARTKRGKRKTVGAMRKKDMTKLDASKNSQGKEGSNG